MGSRAPGYEYLVLAGVARAAALKDVEEGVSIGGYTTVSPPSIHDYISAFLSALPVEAQEEIVAVAEEEAYSPQDLERARALASAVGLPEELVPIIAAAEAYTREAQLHTTREKLHA